MLVSVARYADGYVGEGMSADITESGKAWIHAPEVAKHFKKGDVAFVTYGSPASVGTMEVVQLDTAIMTACLHLPGTYLKLATVAWPEFPYSAEDISE